MGNNTALKHNRKTYLQIIISIALLFVFYKLGFSFYFVIGTGILILLLVLLKGKLYGKLDAFLTAKLPFLSNQSPRIKKLIIVIAFILTYILLKQIIFFVLAQFGIDVQKMMIDGIN